MTPLVLLPMSPLHTPDWANTREARSVVRTHTSGIEAALGEEASLIGQDLPHGLRWRLGLEAAAFMSFEPEGELTFSLLTFDGIFGLPVDLAWRNWRARLEWAHLSAHFADGVRHGEELPDQDQLGPFSREWLGLSLAHQFTWLRPYIESQWIVHSAVPAMHKDCSNTGVKDVRLD